MSNGICMGCGYELRQEEWCFVETIPEYRDRVGRHMGRCWGGTFPKSEPPEVTEDEIEEARKRGRGRFKQLSSEDAA